jgi:hypothetical protein
MSLHQPKIHAGYDVSQSPVLRAASWIRVLRYFEVRIFVLIS